MSQTRRRGLRARLAGLVLRALGWRLEGDFPTRRRYVAIYAPHTSNWDFVLMYLVKEIVQVRGGRYLGKETLFRGLHAPFFRWLGGIPVDRGSRQNAVRRAVEAFDQSDEMVLALAPEGTRRRLDHWKSGFYHIAHEAGVPLLLTYVDAPRRVLGIGPYLATSGDIDRDFAELARFYEGKGGIRAGQESVVSPRSEDSGSTKTSTAPPSDDHSSET